MSVAPTAPVPDLSGEASYRVGQAPDYQCFAGIDPHGMSFRELVVTLFKIPGCPAGRPDLPEHRRPTDAQVNAMVNLAEMHLDDRISSNVEAERLFKENFDFPRGRIRAQCIMLYTMEMQNSLSVYQWLNGWLCSPDRVSDTQKTIVAKFVGPFFLELESGLRALPLMHGVRASRVIKVGLVDKLSEQFQDYGALFKRGAKLNFWGVSSFTTSDEEATKFGDGDQGRVIVFTCPELSCVDIGPFAAHGGTECEVIPLTPSRFSVHSAVRWKNTVVVTVDQITTSTSSHNEVAPAVVNAVAETAAAVAPTASSVEVEENVAANRVSPKSHRLPLASRAAPVIRGMALAAGALNMAHALAQPLTFTVELCVLLRTDAWLRCVPPLLPATRRDQLHRGFDGPMPSTTMTTTSVTATPFAAAAAAAPVPGLAPLPTALSADALLTHTAALRAAEKDNLSELQGIVERFGPEVVLRQRKGGATVIHMAAAKGALGVLEFVASVPSLGPRALAVASPGSGDTAAHQAAQGGHIAVIKFLADTVCPAFIAQPRDNGVTVAQLAATLGSLEILEYIERCPGLGIPALTATSNGDSAAHQAAQGGHLHVIEFLARSLGPEFIAQPRANGVTVAHLAAAQGSLPILKFIAGHPGLGPAALATVIPSTGDTAAHQAAQGGHTAVVKYLSEVVGADLIKQPRASGVTVAQLAATLGSLDLLRFIAECPGLGPAALTAACPADGDTAAHQAAQGGHAEVIKFLAQVAGAEFIKQPRKNGVTVAHLAAAEGSLEILEFIAASPELGVDALTLPIPITGDTTAHQAAQGGHSAVIKFLAQVAGAEFIKQPRKNGVTVAHLAAACGAIDILKFIAAHANLGVDAITAVTPDDGDTAAHQAAQAGDRKVIKYLVEIAGPSFLKLRRKDGVSVAHLAAAAGAVSILEYIAQQHGLGIHALEATIPNSGDTLAHQAAQGGHTHVIRFLLEMLGPEAIKRRRTDGVTVAQLAAAVGSVDILHLIAAHEGLGVAELKTLTADGESTAHQAAQNGHLDAFHFLTSVAGCEFVSGRRRDGATPVLLAAANGSTTILRFIAQHPDLGVAALTAPCLRDGDTVAHQAAQGRHAEALVFIAQVAGADFIKQPRKNGATVAQLAAASGSVEILEYIVRCPGLGPEAIAVCQADGDTAAHQAAQGGHLHVIEFLARSLGPEFIAQPRANGVTVAHLAAAQGSLPILKFIADHPGLGPAALATVIPSTGDTAAHQAAQGGHTAVVKYLSEVVGADLIKQPRASGVTVAQLAATLGSLDLLHFIAECPGLGPAALTAACPADGDTAAHQAAQGGHAEVIKFLAQVAGAEFIKQPRKNGVTVAHLAAAEGSLEILEFIAASPELGVDMMSSVIVRTGDTAAHQAAQYGHADTIKYLARTVGPHLIARARNDGVTVAQLAAASGSLEILEFIAECPDLGVDAITTVIEQSGDTAALQAAQGGHAHIIGFLARVTSAAFMLRARRDGATISHLACGNGCLDCVRAIMDAQGLGPEAVGVVCPEDGDTGAHQAAQGGHTHVIEFLAQALGSSCLRRTRKDGSTVVHLAAASGSLDILKFVHRHPDLGVLALRTARPEDGVTAAHLAALGDHLECFTYLAATAGPDFIKKPRANDETVFDVAVAAGSTAVLRYLMSRTDLYGSILA